MLTEMDGEKTRHKSAVFHWFCKTMYTGMAGMMHHSPFSRWIILDTFELKEGEIATEELCIPVAVTWNFNIFRFEDGENTYVLYDPDGNIVYSDGPFPTTQPVGLNIDFSEYIEESCADRLNYVSGSDCDDDDFTKTGEDKDGDGSTLCDGDCDDYDANISGEDLDEDGLSLLVQETVMITILLICLMLMMMVLLICEWGLQRLQFFGTTPCL